MGVKLSQSTSSTTGGGSRMRGVGRALQDALFGCVMVQLAAPTGDVVPQLAEKQAI